MGIGFSLLAFLIVLTPVVFFHELGHFWAARRSGVVVEVFSVGFGPEILGFTDRYGTRWKFAAIPLGGYVRMAGDQDPSSTPSPEAANIKGSFQSVSLGAKAFIVAMGPIANFILGIVIIAGIYVSFGKVLVPNVIGDVQPGSAADQAGMVAGDKITEVNGSRVVDFGDLRGYVFENPGKPIEVVLERNGRAIMLTVVPDVVEDRCLNTNYGRLGVVSSGGELKTYGPGEALLLATTDSFKMAIAMLRGIGRLASGNANKGEIGGPVKIAEISGRAASQGLVSLAMFMAVISINLGLVNLLPVPALDGGHLMFFGIQKLLGRPMNQRMQEIIMRAGMALLFTLIIVVTVYDILGNIGSDC
jgi:regulator of sigma E protease